MGRRGGVRPSRERRSLHSDAFNKGNDIEGVVIANGFHRDPPYPDGGRRREDAKKTSKDAATGLRTSGTRCTKQNTGKSTTQPSPRVGLIGPVCPSPDQNLEHHGKHHGDRGNADKTREPGVSGNTAQG